MDSLTRKEKWALAASAIAGFFLLGGYSFMRSATPGLFVEAYGADKLSIALLAMTASVLMAVWIYGRLLSAFGPRSTFHLTTLFSGVFMGLCYFGMRKGYDWSVALIHVYKDVYVVLLIEQIWSFINSSVREETAKKFNGPMMGVMSLGAIISGAFVGATSTELGTHTMVLMGVILLFPLPIVFSAELAFRNAGEPHEEERKPKKQDGWGLHCFKEHPQLLYLMFIVIASQVVSTATTLRMIETVSGEFSSVDQQTAYLGSFYSVVSIVTSVMQFVVTPFLLVRFSQKFTFHLIPFVHLGIAIYSIFFPTLAAVTTASMVFKSMDYSLFRGCKELVYIPLPFDARYRSKELIDVLGYRFGKGLTAVLVALIRNMGALSGYSVLALVAAGGWLGMTVGMFRPRPRQQPDVAAGALGLSK